MKTITVKSAKMVEYMRQNPLGDELTVTIAGEEHMDASDGYHTFQELYDHRHALFIAFCKERNLVRILLKKEGTIMNGDSTVWRSKFHSDGSEYEGWFILGIGKETGSQISYHLPMSLWDDTDFAETLDNAPAWDGHTSADVLKRLKTL